MATARGEIYPPKMRVPQMNISTALEAITMKALATDQDNRYQDTNDMIKDLDSYTAGFATAAENANIFTQLFLLVKRHKTFFATVAIAFIAIIVIVAGFMITLKQKEQIAIAANKKSIKQTVIAKKEREYAEKLAKHMLFDLFDKLENAGKLKLLDDVATQVLEYYNKRNKDDLTDEQWEQFSDAYDKIGDVYKDQGKSEEALKAYQEAFEITKRLSEKENNSQVVLAKRYRKTAIALFAHGKIKVSVERIKQAITILEKESKQKSNDTVIKLELCKAYWDIFEICYGSFSEESKEYARKGMLICEKLYLSSPSNTKYLLQLGKFSFILKANNKNDKMKIHQYLKYCQKGFDIVNKKSIENPQNTKNFVQLAEISQNLSELNNKIEDNKKSIMFAKKKN